MTDAAIASVALPCIIGGMKQTTLKFLTPAEIDRCIKLYKEAPIGSFAKLCDKQIIEPVLPRIEEYLGQRMNSRYVAYMVEYAIMQAEGRKWSV